MEIIQEILMLYYEINRLYLELYKLELEGKKENIEFIELVGVLKQKIEHEVELFNRFYENIDGDFSYSVLDDGTPYAKRMIDYMNFYEALNVTINDDDTEEVVADKMYDMKYAKLYKACSNNIFLIYLSFLQECIDDKNNSFFRDKIISFKYYNSFINHDVEDCLINTDFNVSSVNYVNLYFVAETLGIDINMCDNIILDCFKDTIEITVNQILSISDSDYCDDQNRAISINNQSLLRASLSMMNNSDYIKNKDWIYGLINGLANDNNRIGVDTINSIIMNMNKDKVRVRKISMRPLNG